MRVKRQSRRIGIGKSKIILTRRKESRLRRVKYDCFETELEKDHGRIEQRRCWITEEIDWLEQKEDWKNLRSALMAEAVREVIGKDNTVERRYFMSGLEANAELALRCARGHWAIERRVASGLRDWLSRR